MSERLCRPASSIGSEAEYVATVGVLVVDANQKSNSRNIQPGESESRMRKLPYGF